MVRIWDSTVRIKLANPRDRNPLTRSFDQRTRRERDGKQLGLQPADTVKGGRERGREGRVTFEPAMDSGTTQIAPATGGVTPLAQPPPVSRAPSPPLPLALESELLLLGCSSLVEGCPLRICEKTAVPPGLRIVIQLGCETKPVPPSPRIRLEKKEA